MSEAAGPPWDHRAEADRLADSFGVPRWDTPPRLVIQFLPEHDAIDAESESTTDRHITLRSYGLQWAGPEKGWEPAWVTMYKTTTEPDGENYWIGIPDDSP